MNLLWATLVVILSCAIAVVVLLVVRRFSPHGGHFGDSGPAAGVFTILATFFAVLFAFVVFFAFESYDRSSASAETEAQVVTQQFETAQLLPESSRAQLSAELTCYARSVVHQEWPAMERGAVLDTNQWDTRLFRTLQDVEPTTPTEQAAYAKWLDQRSEREQARLERDLGEDGVIPVPLWFVLGVSAAVVWAFVFLFADRGEGAVVQAIMIGTVTVMIVSGLLVINFLDYPYSRGSGGLRPTAMEQSQQEMVETTRVLGLDLPELCDETGQPIGTAAGN
jgi:uncharacterized membrane protein